MHLIIGLIILIIVGAIAWWFLTEVFIPYILPFIGILFICVIIAGILYGIITSTANFYRSFIKNINPYKSYIDKNSSKVSGVKRSYFFGPGYHQIMIIVRDAFTGQAKQWNRIIDFGDYYAESVYGGIFRKAYIMFKNTIIWTGCYVAGISIYAFGCLWIAVFSVILASVTFVGMCLFFMFFGVLWLSDRGFLLMKSITFPCPNCKRLEESIVKRIASTPIFVCPSCGQEHSNLTPGAYGVLKRTCTCGENMPTTFFNGRSRLEAKCPYCQMEIAVSDAEQFGIQIIGGVSAGKTSYVAAFWHQYINKLKFLRGISYEKFPPEAFEELERWYQQGISESTTQTNANMYSIIHRRAGRTAYQLNIYDIAGEAFANLNSDIQQQQFKYCKGLVFIIDPNADPSDINETFSDFIRKFKALRNEHTTKKSDIPVAVVISKADLYKKEIGLMKINAHYKNNPNKFAREGTKGSFELTRNAICIGFLKKQGFGAVYNLLDSEFSNAQYFPVSAMGREGEIGQPYRPSGVMEPALWILGHTKGGFRAIISRL